MALPTCSKCGSHNFEVQSLVPENSDHALTFVICCKCGMVAGVVGETHVGHLLERAVGQIANKLGVSLDTV